MLYSMTALGAAQGSYETFDWSWDIRSVNGKGLDLRLRMPDWIEGLERAVRTRIGQSLARGNVTVSLKLNTRAGDAMMRVNPVALDAMLEALREIESAASERGLALAPSRATDIAGLRGVLDSAPTDETTEPLLKALLHSFEVALADFLAMRRAEGDSIATVLSGQVARIAELTQDATAAIADRRSETEAGFRAALARITDATDRIDADRIAQELALLAVKTDVTEELDRLTAHVTAAQDLMAQGSPVGRKLDFLSQEFNREANTLCSKAQSSKLGAIGLELKSVIDQLREQVQNIE